MFCYQDTKFKKKMPPKMEVKCWYRSIFSNESKKIINNFSQITKWESSIISFQNLKFVLWPSETKVLFIVNKNQIAVYILFTDINFFQNQTILKVGEPLACSFVLCDLDEDHEAVTAFRLMLSPWSFSPCVIRGRAYLRLKN